MTMRLLPLVFFVFLTAGLHQAAAAEAQPVPVAIADFDNFDTAGEEAQRTAEHAARVNAFTDLLRTDLAADGRYRIVPLVCPRLPCSPESMSPAAFLQAARDAGARF